MHKSPSTHRARFKSNVSRNAIKAPRPQRQSRSPNGQNLSMRSRVLRTLPQVARPSQQSPIRADQHAPNRDLAKKGSPISLSKRKLHPVKIRIHAKRPSAKRENKYRAQSAKTSTKRKARPKESAKRENKHRAQSASKRERKARKQVPSAKREKKSMGKTRMDFGQDWGDLGSGRAGHTLGIFRAPGAESAPVLTERHRVFVRPGRFELPTTGSVDRCSIQLSYGRIRRVVNIVGRSGMSR